MLISDPFKYQSKCSYSLPVLSNEEMSSLKIKGVDKQEKLQN